MGGNHLMLGLALSFAGCAALASGMHRHGSAITGRRLNPAERHRRLITGALLLLAGAAITVAVTRWREALLQAVGQAAFAALLLTLLLWWRPRLAVPAAAVMVGVGALLTLA